MMSSLPRLIALTSTCPRWAGDQQPDFVLALCRRLQPWFRVTILAPHAAGASLHEDLEGVEVIRFRYAPDALERLAYESGMAANLRARPWLLMVLPVFFRAQARALRQLVIVDEGPVTVHAHWLFPQGWLAVRALHGLNVPLMVTAHGSDVLGLRGAFWDCLHRQTLAGIQAVTAVGPEVAERIRSLGGGSGQPILLPLGVDTDFFAPGDQPRSTRQIVFAGRLERDKGGVVLLRAVAALRQAGRRLRVIVAGEGPAREALRHLAATLGLAEDIEFVGWQDRVGLRDLYRSAACCIFPSLREGFGLALVEALACGVPVLASDLPAFRYIDDGVGAIRFAEAGDENALAQGLADVLDASEVRLYMSKRGRERALTFSASINAAAYAEMLLGLIDGQGA